MAVEQFRGPHFPLSNMYPLGTWIKTDSGVTVPTSEHAYMANRLEDPSMQVIVALARGEKDDPRPFKDGLAAKETAHRFIEQGAIQMFDDEVGCLALMHRVLIDKVLLNSDVYDVLVATGDEEIVEGNSWGDHFWGVSPVGSRNGENHLGRLWMRIREELRRPL
jgi:predicted NAD-dependent protein-ADP-ribosyltransferase YbiA (DUF1768 family)